MLLLKVTSWKELMLTTVKSVTKSKNYTNLHPWCLLMQCVVYVLIYNSKEINNSSMKILVCKHFNNRSYVCVVLLRCVIFIVPLVQVDTVKRMYIKKLPKVLVIQLKRFDYDWER